MNLDSLGIDVACTVLDAYVRDQRYDAASKELYGANVVSLRASIERANALTFEIRKSGQLPSNGGDVALLMVAVRSFVNSAWSYPKLRLPGADSSAFSKRYHQLVADLGAIWKRIIDANVVLQSMSLDQIVYGEEALVAEEVQQICHQIIDNLEHVHASGIGSSSDYMLERIRNFAQMLDEQIEERYLFQAFLRRLTVHDMAALSILKGPFDLLNASDESHPFHAAFSYVEGLLKRLG